MEFDDHHGLGYYEAASDVADYFFLRKETNNCCRAHYHNSIEVVFVRKGKHAVWINGEKSELNAGDLCICNGFDVHYYHYVGESQTDIMLASKELLSPFSTVYPNAEFPNILRKTGDSARELEELLDIMHRNLNSNRQVILGLVNAFWGVLLKYYVLHQKSKVNTDGIVEVLAYIDDHFAENLTIESLAEKFSYNKVYFSRMFNNAVGMHFRDYLNRVRLYRFGIMRQEDKNSSVTTLATACGFENMSTYYRAVKKEQERIKNGDI